MKSITLTGILLIVLGVLIFAYKGITYSKREKIVDIGPIEATKETRKTIPIPPILGVWPLQAELGWWSLEIRSEMGLSLNSRCTLPPFMF